MAEIAPSGRAFNSTLHAQTQLLQLGLSPVSTGFDPCHYSESKCVRHACRGGRAVGRSGGAEKKG